MMFFDVNGFRYDYETRCLPVLQAIMVYVLYVNVMLLNNKRWLSIFHYPLRLLPVAVVLMMAGHELLVRNGNLLPAHICYGFAMIMMLLLIIGHITHFRKVETGETAAELP